MCASMVTSQVVLPFIPASMLLSGKLGADPFVGREGTSVCAFAG